MKTGCGEEPWLDRGVRTGRWRIESGEEAGGSDHLLVLEGLLSVSLTR